MKLIKDGKVIEATEKAYNLIYKHRGFKIYNPDTHLLAYLEREIDKTDEVDAIEEIEEIKPYKEITKGEIIEILTEKGIEHNPRDKKEILYSLMIKGD